MARILPKGIIVNSPHINGHIEQLDSQPVSDADLARLWRVYTTTQRRLRDPTAERLENLWWRIWGSQGKRLKGAIVAKLFAQISDGETFVPLRGPPNRDEGPSLNTTRRLGPRPGASSTTALHQSNRSKPGTESSSSSKNAAPMPHPILKKTRGPSSTGPRPTARFISPHETEDENGEEDSSSVGTNAHVVVEPPSPIDPQDPKTEKKSAGLSIKKRGRFVAATKTKRPVVSRRQSSQTSQSSNDSPSKFSAIQSSSERTPPTFGAQSRIRAQPRFQENFSPSSGHNGQSPKNRNVSRASASDTKRAGVSPRKAVSATRKERISTSDDAGKPTPSSGDPGPSTVLRLAENQQEIDPHNLVDPESLTEEELQELEMQRILLEEANARVERQNRTAAQLIQESNAANSTKPTRSASDNHGLLSHASKSKSSASLAPTLTAAAGQINMSDIDTEGLQQTSRSASAGRLDKGKGRDPEELKRTEMFGKRPVKPATPASAPNESGTLSRSKSQLTLLLEKDRARSGESKP